MAEGGAGCGSLRLRTDGGDVVGEVSPDGCAVRWQLYRVQERPCAVHARAKRLKSGPHMTVCHIHDVHVATQRSSAGEFLTSDPPPSR